MSGWIKLHRQMIKSDLWKSEPFTRGQAWVDLLLLANHKPGFIRARGVRIDVLRGQVGTSQVELSKRWQWSRGKVKRFLNELEMDQQIEQQKNNVSSLITICNYSHYQGDDTANDTANDTASDTANGTLTRMNKNNKEINNSLSEQSSDCNSWLKNADKFYLDLCKWFYDNLVVLELVKKNTNWKTKSWYNGFRLLLTNDGVDYETEFRPIMNFYLQNYGKQFCPIAESPASVRTKWKKIEMYYKNGNRKPLGSARP